MKKIPALVWLPLALVVGGLVGAYGPTEELRTREERADAEKTKAKAKQKSAGAFGSFAQIVNIPDEAKRPRRPRPATKSKAGNSAAATNSAASAEADVAATKTNAAKTNAPAARNRKPEKRLSPEDLKARYDAIGACAGDGKRDEVSNLNLADFIDPSVAEPFVAVQDKLESMK